MYDFKCNKMMKVVISSVILRTLIAHHLGVFGRTVGLSKLLEFSFIPIIKEY